MMRIRRTVGVFLLPGGVVFFAAFCLVQWGKLPELFPSVDSAYPMIVLFSGLLMGWRFHRSKLVFAVLTLVLLDRVTFYLGSGDVMARHNVDAAWAAVAVLLPVSFGAIASVQERGVFSLHGICRLSLVLLQWPVVYLLARYPHLRAVLWLQAEWVRIDWINRLPMAQPALLAFVVALTVTLVCFVRHRSALDAGLFWALLCGAAGICTRDSAPNPTIYCSTGALILIICAVEVSFGMAFRDELTGLPARRAMNEALLRLGSTYAVGMADVDHFKKFNDRFGHDIGDQVLRMVASQLSKVGGGGRAYRYGGEEFAVIFPGRTKKEAMLDLEKVRLNIAALEFVIRGPGRPRQKPDEPKAVRIPRKKITITISMGVADSQRRPDDPLGVIHAADKALYRAKRGGRNRVSV